MKLFTPLLRVCDTLPPGMPPRFNPERPPVEIEQSPAEFSTWPTEIHRISGAERSQLDAAEAGEYETWNLVHWHVTRTLLPGTDTHSTIEETFVNQSDVPSLQGKETHARVLVNVMLGAGLQLLRVQIRQGYQVSTEKIISLLSQKIGEELLRGAGPNANQFTMLELKRDATTSDFASPPAEIMLEGKISSKTR